MSTGLRQRANSNSIKSSSVRSNDVKLKPPTPGQDEFAFEPCAATGSYLLYAQRNVILCLHHDTLAVERRFDSHREDVSWISVDTSSERGAGRLVVSYDAGSTAIVWDLFTGDEVARFASYEQIRVATWMRNGNVAFGNAQGNIILFEPSTSEHLSARTIFDPITALAPAADCRTFAIGYLNGSILIATLQPSFTILHTLTTPRSPSPIAGLAWHGSSSKQKSDMLAAQTSDGDLRVWSVPKVPHGSDAPCVIRVLNQKDQREPGPCWFAWSKNGRIVQYTEGQTCAWDVRTKRVSYEPVPTTDGIAAICNYGPTATLFTIGRNSSIQQYDINPSNGPATMVANVQHAPANTPPSPPISLGEHKKQMETPLTALPSKSIPLILADSESSADEGVTMSPLQKIAQEMDQLEEERRDRVGPLSPVSSRGSQSSKSSGSGRAPRYRYDRPSTASQRSTISKSSGGSGTIFSSGTSSLAGTSTRESISIRSISSAASSRYTSSALRKEVLRSPDESKKNQHMDLFPFTKARLSDVPFRSTNLGPERTADDLRLNMLKVVFGWDHDIDELVQDELARHPPGSAAAVLLSKWLGDLSADVMADMVGSESMTSSDWMLLALSNLGKGSQKKVGEAFVQRLLEKGDIHPAVAIFLGLGEHNDAIEVYVSRKYYMEAILLTCLTFPTDWQRQSFLVRKWGEHAVGHGKAELAVRCFSCMGLETTEPWFSPRAQDAVFSAQKQALLGSQVSPPLSPPSVGSSRVAARMASLKLVTDFSRGPQPKQMVREEDGRTPMNAGVTPIAESAISPAVGNHHWLGRARDPSREPSSARTATPGSYGRKRLPSRSDADRNTTNNQVLASLAIPDRGQRGESHPRTAIDNVGREAETLPFSTRRATSGSKDFVLSATTFNPGKSSDHLPSPAVGVFDALKDKRSDSRASSRSRNIQDLHLDMKEKVVESGPETGYTNRLSPPLTGASIKSAKARSIDQYISSLDEANHYAQNRANSRNEDRPPSRTARAHSRNRDDSQSRGRSGVRYIRPAKRSPSSPVPMSPEDAGIYASTKKEAGTNTEDFDDERFYKMSIASPVVTESVASTRTARSRPRHGVSKTRSSSKTATRRGESPEGGVRARSKGASRASSRRPAEYRGRSASRGERSPVSPQPMQHEESEMIVEIDAVRPRQRSSSRRPTENSRREASPERRAPRDRSMSRKPTPAARESSRTRGYGRDVSPDSLTSGRSGVSRLRPSTLSRRALAARELEERRLSLARRPSAPIIPHPGELAFRPVSHERSNTDDMLNSMSMYRDPIQRSQTADPEMTKRYSPTNRVGAGPTSNSSAPIGLPANPRVRHPRYMTAEPNEDDIPAVPSIPDNMQQPQEPHSTEDDIGPLLPATTFGQPISPPRSMSAPPQDMLLPSGSYNSPTYPTIGRRPSLGGSRGHARQNTMPEILPQTNYKRHSPPPITASIAETIHESQVVILDQEDKGYAPPLLSQLQHLATPPPPPPPPLNIGGGNGVGMINIAIEGNSPGEKPMEVSPTNASATGSPHTHRRGRGSVSENLGMTFKRVTERMRSTSRGPQRAKSPPSTRAEVSPYESVPEMSFPRGQNTHSPPANHVKHESYFGQIPPPPPPPPQPMEQVIPPSDMNQSFYRTPKELRANMPPNTLQAGVYQGGETPMI
ncbi:WD domain containing protein [Pyrenophora tritici-repentis]|uniref:WD domain containing protein n=2 Tax=Pyrenophora tritici-repentis TaxID=45151 RepID=A0A922NS75_9PLEO|nr:WD domain containing protein [Pyrenophora tritici-repentis Pt-1C-BFP]EDU39854.1 WD domain containing protein [Pyrenophora tritici-repentis Pt-1C-BFP]KAI1520299.1 WD domain containing protein [Pyrenophora tritici-repentis]KAI1675329.1 WD domain containing protein [Pyrenophora tritici-repentis]KAI1687518.1 WD domain containing protein [Pyrenophora tritici-repentis]